MATIENGVADTRRPVVRGKSRMERVLGRALRMTSVFDRKGTRWLIQVLSPPPTVIILVNRGRIYEENLKDEGITHEELLQALRENGCSTLDECRLVVLEVDGRISIVENKG